MARAVCIQAYITDGRLSVIQFALRPAYLLLKQMCSKQELDKRAQMPALQFSVADVDSRNGCFRQDSGLQSSAGSWGRGILHRWMGGQQCQP